MLSFANNLLVNLDWEWNSLALNSWMWTLLRCSLRRFSSSDHGCEPHSSMVSCLVFLVTKMNFKVGRQRFRVRYLAKAKLIDMWMINLGRNHGSHHSTHLPTNPSEFPHFLLPSCQVSPKGSPWTYFHPPTDLASLLLCLSLLHLTFNMLLMPDVMQLHIWILMFCATPPCSPSSVCLQYPFQRGTL